MRLNLLYEDHWEPIAGHPGKLGDKDPRAKKNKKRPSFLVHPEDRERWLKWFSGGKKIKEDLDDVDEFSNAPTQEQLEQVIDQLYADKAFYQQKGMPSKSHILRTMERMYQQMFGRAYQSPFNTGIKEGLDDNMFGSLDDKDEFDSARFQRQEIANNIKKLRYIAASSDNPKHRQNAATLAKSMESLYLSQFGEPYNPTN